MRTLVLLLTLIASPAFAADWSVGPAPGDDPKMLAATVLNEDGHALFLWGRAGNHRFQLFAELHLGRGQTFGARMPVYRIDGGEPVDTEVVRQEGEALSALWGHVGKRAAFWLAWTSIQDRILPTDSIADWFAGKEIEVGYTAADGTIRTTRFPLAGAAAAVRSATGFVPP